MALETEALIDRRRIRRRLTFWRFAAVIIALLAIAALLLSNRQFAAQSGILPHIARVDIDGIITDDRKMTELLDRLGRANQVKAVILSINSPGGTATGGEALYLAIRRLAAKKPVVASCGTLAASAAYIAAIATDHIVVLGNTMTGSVGVIFQWFDVTKLLDTIGVKVEEQRSGPLKAVPDPFQPTDAQTREFTKSMVDDAKEWFFGLVRERRHLDLGTVPGLTDGSAYSGRQAVSYKLADEVGDERTALRWLQQKKGISSNLKVIEWQPEEASESLIGSLFHAAGSAFGLSTDNIGALLAQVAHPLQLDGLISLWHANGS